MIVAKKVSSPSTFPILVDTVGNIDSGQKEFYGCNPEGSDASAIQARHSNQIQSAFLGGNVEHLIPAAFRERTKASGFFGEASSKVYKYKTVDNELKDF